MRGTLPKKDGVENNALYSDSTLAIDPDTGKLKWYHQYLQNDTWDLDYVYERILVDLPINGETRKALVTTGKLGIIEAIDRINGQWLWAQGDGAAERGGVVRSQDRREDHQPRRDSAYRPDHGELPGRSRQPRLAVDRLQPEDPAALSAAQRVSAPTRRRCRSIAGQAYTGGGRAIFVRSPVPNSDGNIGRVDAVKLADRSQAWSHRQRSPETGAMLPTGGGVVFTGTWDRYFRAFDDTTGKVLWQTRTNNAVNGFPITFMVNGKQYVAVATGNGSSEMKSLATLTPGDRGARRRLGALGVRAAGQMNVAGRHSFAERAEQAARRDHSMAGARDAGVLWRFDLAVRPSRRRLMFRTNGNTGRARTARRLHYCVDERDPDLPVARKIGAAIAGALLLEPKEHPIGRPTGRARTSIISIGCCSRPATSFSASSSSPTPIRTG